MRDVHADTRPLGERLDQQVREFQIDTQIDAGVLCKVGAGDADRSSGHSTPCDVTVSSATPACSHPWAAVASVSDPEASPSGASENNTTMRVSCGSAAFDPI
jgi:hypothetical protein